MSRKLTLFFSKIDSDTYFLSKIDSDTYFPRTVNIGKDGYLFASALRIDSLMTKFEAGFLHVYTPCNRMSQAELEKALALCQVEFIIIHPFREGNGRLSRVLATVMALQAGYPPLDFTWMAENREEYFAAIQHGHAGDFEPIRKIFSTILLASQSGD